MKPKINRFSKIMVANRGEIAIRILRAASELKLRTVAIYTYEDRYSLHRYKADESYQIGANDEPLKPYLNIEEIIRVALEYGVEAIHPGYGFLSENVEFARRCRESGIVFIGPPAEVMERLGDKMAAKVIARAQNVPLIEDSQVDLDSDKVILSEGRRIGFPVMVKAVSGGGGRGMRIVRSEDELLHEAKEASREAKTAFGDGTIFLEKYIENPKHIEVQILGDKYGNLIHLFERDCSVQRRFQKVVEIAPSFGLKQETKDALYKHALNITRAVDYSHAGTVEFLVDAQENLYFIEVNPRIQVEHTITEQITGVDLVAGQILIAMGYALDHHDIDLKEQEKVKCSGFAIQCRITTEDPSDNFKPDYGTIIAYRSASGMGIRLDAGSAYVGASISPFFDSMLVKATATGRTLAFAADRLHRALREFRIRGVKTNIGFLLNLLAHPTFQAGKATVNFISENPQVLFPTVYKDRGTKMLRYLADVIVNGNPDVKYVDEKKVFRTPIVPDASAVKSYPKGTRDLLIELGPQEFSKWLKNEKPIHYTDTTFRDAHQSLLATRVRTYDMMQVAESFAKLHGDQVFSMEVWGGATFDVAYRFLKESPWSRLDVLREAIPNVLFQMLLRGSNAVGYKAYPDNLIIKFIEQASETGIDVFRIFDSLNWVEAMKVSIDTVNKRTKGLAEACICFSGNFMSKDERKFTLDYYIDLAKRLEDAGAHILGIKDMAGLLKPYAATELIAALKDAVDIPLHLHTHDTSSIQSSTYLKAIEAGVDVIDLALGSMSGLTSQPNFNSVVAMMEGQEREQKVDLKSLNQFSNYWETVRTYYYPFETELKAGTAEVYDHEIPGGQYSNLRPQARGLGLEDQFETIKENYEIVNGMLGGIVKVTPSSKVVGDMAMFMTSNKLSKADVLNPKRNLAYPESFKSLLRGELGQNEGGFPSELVKIVLKDEVPFKGRPNEHLEPVDFDKEMAQFEEAYYPYVSMLDFLGHQLYPKVFSDYFHHHLTFGSVRRIPTKAFFYGLDPNEEILINLEPGKNILVQYLNVTKADKEGNCLVYFKLNGQTRAIQVHNKNIVSSVVANQKASDALNEIGAPLQGSLSQLLVEVGDDIKVNDPLFVIEAMKMESTISAPVAGVIKKIYLAEKTMVEQDDLVIEIE